MASPQVISLSSSPRLQPNLSVSNASDVGTIKLNNLPPSLGSPKKSVNFGPGADLLMNQNRASRANSPRSDISISELKSLDINATSMSRKNAENLMMGARTSTGPPGQNPGGIRIVGSAPGSAPGAPSATTTTLPSADKSNPAIGTATAQDPNKK